MAKRVKTAVEGSGTALDAPLTLLASDTMANKGVEPLPPSRLLLAATAELDGASDPARTKPPPDTIGLPSGADGAKVNTEPLPITSDV